MQKELTSDLNRMVQKLQKLPQPSQKQIFDLIDFFYFKTFSQLYNDLLEEEEADNLSLEDRQELNLRIHEFENNPESAISGEDIKKKWEDKLGRQL